eukprot:1192966-Prorocentrum_minimum.AAC.5
MGVVCANRVMPGGGGMPQREPASTSASARGPRADVQSNLQNLQNRRKVRSEPRLGLHTGVTPLLGQSTPGESDSPVDCYGCHISVVSPTRSG